MESFLSLSVQISLSLNVMAQLQAICPSTINFHCLSSSISFSIKDFSNVGHTTVFFCVCRLTAESYNAKIESASAREQFFMTNFLLLSRASVISLFELSVEAPLKAKSLLVFMTIDYRSWWLLCFEKKYSALNLLTS